MHFQFYRTGCHPQKLRHVMSRNICVKNPNLMKKGPEGRNKQGFQGWPSTKERPEKFASMPGVQKLEGVEM